MEEATALKWVKANDGDVPKYAVEGGEIAGETVYIGRALSYDRSLNPGVIVKSYKACLSVSPKSQNLVGLQSQNQFHSRYEVLVCPNPTDVIGWVETTGDNIPPNALNGGFEKPGEPYYIGRRKLGKGEKNFIIGKVNPREGVLAVYFTDTNTTSTFDKYEVLVTKKKVEIVVDILRQTLYDVKYNTSARAVKHTTIPSVALANAPPINNTSSLPQKMITNTSLCITETFRWLADKSTKKGPLTAFKCGVPYIPFDDNHDVVSVTPTGILPEQKPKVDRCPSLRGSFIISGNVYPRVSAEIVGGAMPANVQNYLAGSIPLTTTSWGNPIVRCTASNQNISYTVPPHTVVTVVVEGTKHILEVPYVANLSKVYKNGMTAEEEYQGTFQSTWFSDIVLVYGKEQTK